MNFNFSALFAAILAEGGDLISEFEAEFSAIAHGEGGVQKVANAASGLAAIAGTIAKVAVDVGHTEAAATAGAMASAAAATTAPAPASAAAS